MLFLRISKLGSEEPIEVSVDAGAKVADVLTAAGLDGYTATLLDGCRVLRLQDSLEEAGIAEDSCLTIVMIPSENLACLTVTGIGHAAYKSLQEGLLEEGFSPIEMAHCGGDALCFYSCHQQAEEARSSAALKSAMGMEEKRREDIRRQEGGRIIFGSMDASVRSCKDSCCGIAHYHLDALCEATEEGALLALGASSEGESGIRAALKRFVDSATKEDADEKSLATCQAEQCQVAALQLRVLDATPKLADEELDPETEEKIKSLRTLLGLIVRGLLLMHVDRFAETLAQLGEVTGIEAFQIETE
eukprot:TRINITY_DN21042_c0_g1_i1.p1 TRINITY_DN21042_c0_g1~~TRINITY_DN21042_c0_g1_i1.p1  ORF type:complete len:316 (-),score=54.63 TRINITY_DN21042_c0_g1_i1:113-1024(-)